MTNVNEFYGSDWLKAADLRDKEHTVVISKFETNDREKQNQRGETYTQRRLVLHFQGKKKKLELANINAAAITILYGETVEEWVGKSIVLYPTMTQFGNKMVPCVRIKPPSVNMQIADNTRPRLGNGQPVQQSTVRAVEPDDDWGGLDDDSVGLEETF